MNILSEYKVLNSLAKKNSIVLMGTSTMSSLRLNEMLTDYELSLKIYNRSAKGLTASNARDHFDQSVAALEPSILMINIGENEESDPAVPMKNFRDDLESFIKHVKSLSPSSRIILLEIPGNSERAADINRAIKEVSVSCNAVYAPLSEAGDYLSIRYLTSMKPYLFKKRIGFADAFAFAGI